MMSDFIYRATGFTRAFFTLAERPMRPNFYYLCPNIKHERTKAKPPACISVPFSDAR